MRRKIKQKDTDWVALDSKFNIVDRDASLVKLFKRVGNAYYFTKFTKYLNRPLKHE